MNHNDVTNVASGQVPNAAETALDEYVTGHVLQQDYRVKFFDLTISRDSTPTRSSVSGTPHVLRDTRGILLVAYLGRMGWTSEKHGQGTR